MITCVEAGSSSACAARCFSIGRTQVYVWLTLPKNQLKLGKLGPKKARKIYRQRLAAAIEVQPNRLQQETGY